MRLYEIVILLGIPSSAVLLSVWADETVRRHQQRLDGLQGLSRRMKDGVV